MGNNLFSYQLFFSVEIEASIVQFRLALLEIEVCHLDIRHGSLHSGFGVIVFQPGNDFTLFHPVAFLHAEKDETSGDLGSHGCLPLGNHVATGIEQGEGLGRIDFLYSGDLHLNGRF